MALALSLAVRNARANQHGIAIDAGGGAGFIRIYDGTRPASGGAATTLLAQLTFSATSFPAAVNGVATADPIADDASAVGGTASWFRTTDSTGTFVEDGDVGTAGTDMIVNTTAVSAGQPFGVTSYVLTEGNA